MVVLIPVCVYTICKIDLCSFICSKLSKPAGRRDVNVVVGARMHADYEWSGMVLINMPVSLKEHGHRQGVLKPPKIYLSNCCYQSI